MQGDCAERFPFWEEVPIALEPIRDAGVSWPWLAGAPASPLADSTAASAAPQPAALALAVFRTGLPVLNQAAGTADVSCRSCCSSSR